MPGLPAYRRITKQSQSDGGFLTRGPLSLNLDTRVLRGPDGACTLAPADFAVMRLLMRARLVPLADLVAAVAAATGRSAGRPHHALAMRIVRLRAVLERVGVDGYSIRNHMSAGYRLYLAEQDCMIFVGDRLAVLRHLMATHSDQVGAAFVMGV